jgi:hypothetical protein
MFSMPLAYPSTLDRRNAASYVEELWSPALVSLSIIRRQKPQLIQRRILLRRKRRRTFLSQAGPRVHVVHLKLGITFLRCSRFVPDTTKATLTDRPRKADMRLKR